MTVSKKPTRRRKGPGGGRGSHNARQTGVTKDQARSLTKAVEALQLRAQGLPYAEIGKLLDVSKATAIAWVQMAYDEGWGQVADDAADLIRTANQQLADLIRAWYPKATGRNNSHEVRRDATEQIRKLIDQQLKTNSLGYYKRSGERRDPRDYGSMSEQEVNEAIAAVADDLAARRARKAAK